MRYITYVALLFALVLVGCKQKTDTDLVLTPPKGAVAEAIVEQQTPSEEQVYLEPPTLEEVKANVEESVKDIQLSIDIDPIKNAPVVPPTIPVEIEQTKPAVSLPKIPDRAVTLMPDVIQAIDDIWPDMPMRSYFPAQIEAESCITLTHSKCWNPRAELKTSREYGFGLGQITIAYNKDGSERFNVFNEVKRQHPDLRNWAWEDRYNPLLQIKAIVVKNKVNWGAIKWETHDLDNKMAFLATYYNGGSPLRDRNLCVQTPGCDPSKWWGNVELYSVKSKTKLKEYGNRSLFEISREYPRKVLIDKRPKYVPYTGT